MSAKLAFSCGFAGLLTAIATLLNLEVSDLAFLLATIAGILTGGGLFWFLKKRRTHK